MGYNLTIGNATPSFSKDYGELSARWDVQVVEVPDAPCFEGDPTGRSNNRSPSYSTWEDFCGAVGLRSLFYGDTQRDGWLQRHPGCVLVTPDAGVEIATALAAYRTRWLTVSPGFSEGSDTRQTAIAAAHMARLIWLDFWVRWALETCETPAIENS